MSYLLPALPPTFDAALRDVRARAWRARVAAARRLASPPQGREREACDALRTMADDPFPAVRQTAIEGLGQLAAVDALPLILARFADGEPTVRQVAIIAASRIGDPAAAEPLRAALEDERPDVRFQAVASFAELCPAEAPAALLPRLEDDDPEVRGHAASALGALGEAAVADAIVPLLSDRVASTRRDAALALAKLDDPRATDVLRECLRDPERAIEAALALGRLRAESAREELAPLAGGLLTSLHMKAACGAALAQMGDPRGVEALRRVLRAFRHDGRSFAAELVGELGLAALGSELAGLADRPRGADPIVVAEALARLAPKSATCADALERIAGGAHPAAADVARASLPGEPAA